MTTVFAGIEAGGTKFVCALGNGYGELYERITIPTTTPEETLGKVIAFLREQTTTRTLGAIGVGSFGPIDAHVDSPTYGYITSTPKAAWINCNLLGTLRQAFDVPMGFTTDVATAALGEYEWGSGKGLQNFLYVTIGTGIGAATMINGEILSGMGHQEMGHMLIRHDLQRDPFGGVCQYHGDCWEGLACGGAIKTRWHVHSALDLPLDHPAWALEAHYVAMGLANAVLSLSPERIILGGGVMRQMHLFDKIRAELLQQLNGYISEPGLLDHIDEYVVPPGLSDHSGVAGAIALARRVA